MGGGTFLIPLLIMFFGADGHAAAVVNLLAFLPTAVVALAVHFKNKMIVTRDLGYIVVPALFSAVAAYFVGRKLSGEATARVFGVFLLILSVILFTVQVKKSKRR